MRWGFIPTLIFLIFSGCGTPSLCELNEVESADGMRTLTCSGTMNERGLRLKLPVNNTDGAFLVSATGTEALAVSLVTDPAKKDLVDATEWYSSSYRYSNGILPYETDTAFNYPVQDIDPELEEGTYKQVQSRIEVLGTWAPEY